MQFYIDSADIEEIRQANKRGWVDGVTTNPTLVAKTGRRHEDVIRDICKEVKGLDFGGSVEPARPTKWCAKVCSSPRSRTTSS